MGFPMAFTSDAALLNSPFCCIHSFVCSRGDLIERADKCGEMSWCLRTLSIANTSGRALCAPTIYTNNNNYYQALYLFIVVCLACDFISGDFFVKLLQT